MAWKFLPYLAAAAFAAILFRLFSQGGDQARSTEESASGNDGTAGGASSTHTSTKGQEVATSSGYDGTAEGQDQARSTEESASENDGTAGGASPTHASTEGQEVATLSGYDGTTEGQDQARSTEESASGNNGTTGGASSTHTSTEGQEVATSSGYDYEVFLNFRGPDTRAAFSDILYTSLNDEGIRTFMDDKELHIGEEFAPELLQAINQSKISVPIFSKGYPSSVWCLKELVQMVKCRKNGRQKIMPIFYDVAPSVVRYQIGIYGEAFLSHEKKQRYGKDTICEWKAALKAVGVINGWDWHSKTNRQEGEFAREVTQKVFTELKKASLAVSDNLVSVDHHVKEIMEKIGAQTSETRIIRIHGMGGIGKTTLAKIVYNQLSKKFNNCCFLVNIREQAETNNGIISLQKKLIFEVLKKKLTNIRDVDEGIQTIRKELSNKKVLVVLDDVDQKKHMDALVGNHDWFGKGSKLIITTRKKEVLKVPEVDDLYEVDMMDSEKSLQLFGKHAFRRDYPLDKDIHQSMRAIKIAGGLPLALEVMGSLLARIEKEKWDVKLKQLEEFPPEDVQSKLKISFDELKYREKVIFLDIACFLIGYDKDIIVHFWESKFHPECAMDVLESMSLIKIKEGNKVWVHDQLRDLGREIIHQESKLKIEEQSRVWDPEEALGLLRSQKKKKKLEALRLHLDHQHCFAYEDFRRLPNLSFLEVCGSKGTFRAEERLLWHASPSNVFPTNEDSHLLPELRWLSWHDIPPTFNITNFSATNVVILNLSQSEITDDWKGWSHVKMMENLKVMDLSHCNYLKRTPDFSAHSKLERLILKVCWGLVEIDKSICQLKSLVFLDVNYCKNLRRLPNTIGDLKSLKELDILNSGIKKLPDSIGKLKLLDKLNISWMGIEKLPHSIGSLELLIELDISYSRIKELPDSIGELQNLKVVKMDGCSISKIPDALWRIEKLEVIEATTCHVNVKIGNDINRALRILELNGARIYEVLRLPEGLTILKLSNLYMNTFPDLSNLTNLEKLELKFARRDSDGESDGPVEEDPMPVRIGNLSKLESLDLMSPYVTALPTDIGSLLPQLKSLELRCPNLSKLESPYVTALPNISLLPQLKHLLLRCPNLDCLPSLPSSLSSLQLESECVTALPTISLLPQLETLLLRCPNLPCLPSLPSGLSSLWLESKCVTTLPTDISTLLPQLGFLKLLCCPNLGDLPSLPSSLSCLWLENGKSCRSMGDLSNLKTLAYLEIIECAISEIQGLDCLENLKTLELRKLQWVEILPDLRNLNKLWRLRVSDCGHLVEIQGEFPSSLRALEILDCGSLQKLPDLSSLKELPSLLLKRCEKLDEEAIYSLYPKEEVESEGDDSESGCEFDDKLEGEDDESGCEFDDELEGEDDESGCESEYGSEGED